MPHRRVLRLRSLVGRSSAALAVVVVLALMPAATAVTYAQGGPDMGMMGPRGMGPRGGPGGGYGVPGQTQRCRDYPGAVADEAAYYGPGYPTSWWGSPWGFPVYASYNLPPYGGFWGFYTDVGPICAWQNR